MKLNLEEMNAQDLFDRLLNDQALTAATKREVVSWLWINQALDDEQQKLAFSRISHQEKQNH